MLHLECTHFGISFRVYKMFGIIVFVLLTAILNSNARACDIEDLTNSLQNATHNCAPNVTFCQSSCTFGYAKEDGMQATNHSCNGTSWVPSGTHCRPLLSPVMWTYLTIVYSTLDQLAESCRYAFNVTLRQALGDFRNTLQSSCADIIEPGAIEIEMIDISTLAFQVTSVFRITFSGSGSAELRNLCMRVIKVTSDVDQTYLKPYASISCGTEVSGVRKDRTTISETSEYSCMRITGSQLVQSAGEYGCVSCSPGNFLNVTNCQACPTEQYQPLPGQLTCDTCPTGKSVTDDRRGCRDSVCVSSFLSQNVPGVYLSCDAQTQTCRSSCLSGYIQDDGGQFTEYNCSSSNGWTPPSKTCIKYEFSTYHTDLQLIYLTTDQVANSCLKSFQSVTSANTASFNTTISGSCDFDNTGGVEIENITITAQAFQILSVFHLKFYNVWSVNNLNLCINIISAIFQNDITYLHPYTKLQCSNGETNVTKYTIQRVGDRIDCPEGRQIINSTQSSFCVPCSHGTYQSDSICLPCPNGTYQPLMGQSFCYKCSDWTKVDENRTECLEVTTTNNISLETTSLNTSPSTAEVTSVLNDTDQTSTQSTPRDTPNTTEKVTTTEGATGTTQQNTSITSITADTTFLPSTTANIQTTKMSTASLQTTEMSTAKSMNNSTTTTTTRTTEGHVIPCSVDRLSSAIPNASYECAINNQTCNVTCNTGFVTGNGESFIQYKCEGDSWTPTIKLCLEYHTPVRTTSLHFLYNAEEQLAVTCLAKFEEITAQNMEAFRTSIANECNILSIKNESITIENITSSALAFELSNVVSVKFSGEEPLNFRQLCLEFIVVIFKNNPTILHPYSPLLCTSGLSNITKVSARLGTSSYLCDNKTYLVNHMENMYCVPCPPGMYMVSSKCELCPDGTYQSLPGQTTCDICTGNKTVVDGGTNCVDTTTTQTSITTIQTSAVTNSNGNIGKSQVDESEGLSNSEIIIISVVSGAFVILIITIAAVLYCKKSKVKRKTSHSDVSSSKTSPDEHSVKSDEYLRRSRELLISEKSESKLEFGTYTNKNIERSTFTSANESKGLDVLDDIIDIEIDNDEHITTAPNMTNMYVREGKWKPKRKHENVTEVSCNDRENDKPGLLCRSLSDYDKVQVYLPEYSDEEVS
ncbi:uncharacterized protein LOC125674083 isoform X2 [Ostrea edulis]|uniref:uncharacterized protein LOC125674083 isoform X2 n=1 Tax=Ostrea edulis TaxID=37623 RepID=UPI0024AF2CF7|nr:uncharacterized protein LOC125674083 isoform X2 [Ostrea edulis]